MGEAKLNKKELASIQKSVELFSANQGRFEQLAKAVMGQLTIHPAVASCIHFIKYRVKDPEHLRKKLERKCLMRKVAIQSGAANIADPITVENLFGRVNDLAGIRLIHLHTQQMQTLHTGIIEVLEEAKYELVEAPTAKCWDAEYDSIYRELGLNTETTLGYSSVHYVVRANSKTEMTCELQVRTLTDEVWGEVSHRVNYPDTSGSETSKDLLKTLARFTTGCTRLVDAIFSSDSDARARE